MVATIQVISQGAPQARRAGEDIQIERNATSSGTEDSFGKYEIGF
jgi:hypothetical protein